MQNRIIRYLRPPGQPDELSAEVMRAALWIIDLCEAAKCSSLDANLPSDRATSLDEHLDAIGIHALSLAIWAKRRQQGVQR